ncbi:hypothetical protein [Nostoc punctiforme]|uniref:hypothetical protein n=1 Tax=Nostoc punctiforme TaxID=272131 RepID=UPI001427E04F|nr:hypothetical protein [Nostoc punctiforme]
MDISAEMRRKIKGINEQKLRCSKLKNSLPAVDRNSSQFVLAGVIDFTAISFHTKQIHTSNIQWESLHEACHPQQKY